MKKNIYSFATFIAIILALHATPMRAQVTVGDLKNPESFSILELVSNNKRGLRLPQLTQLQRDTLDGTAGTAGISAAMQASRNAFAAEKNGKAEGLQIFNTTTKCVETWNGAKWILSCKCGDKPCPEMPVAQPTWGTNPWVGAFWRDNETGERIIAAGNASSWKVDVDDPTGAGAWLKLALGAGNDPDLWSDDPNNAENYQVPGNAKSIPLQPAGNVLFRIGATDVNPQTDGTYETGKRPRYATITLTVGVTEYKLFCRQGESADYVFSTTDTYGGGTLRSATVKFSPYNLTDAALSETVLSHNTAINGGVFVDFPTKAGAFWQWGTDINDATAKPGNIRMAYHPTNPTGSVSDWDKEGNYESANRTWDQFTGSNRLETCPQGWRRFMVGDTTTVHNTQLASGSELMQSLYYNTFDGATYNNNSANYRYWGYYADGYFDRRTITSSDNSNSYSTVSKSTKDVAYCGLLFTNPGTGASLFMPGGGYRDLNYGWLEDSGIYGSFWSSSAYNLMYGWLLGINSSNATQSYTNRNYGFSVRCVKE